MDSVIRAGRMNGLTATGIPGGRAQACHVGTDAGIAIAVAVVSARPSFGSRRTKRPAHFGEALVRASTSAP